MFGLLAIANLLSFYFSDVFYNNIYTYNLVKGVFNTYISIAILGYFVSKYKFCVYTLVSFYAIILLRFVYLISLISSNSENIIFDILSICIIKLSILIIIMYKFKK